MPDFNTEMANVPIGQLLTATLDSAVAAQYSASLKSFELFKAVAFDDNGDTRYVSFDYDRNNPDYDPTSLDSQPTISQTIRVPQALFFKNTNIEIATLDFEMDVELNSMDYTKKATSFEAEASLALNARLGGWGRLQIKGKVAHKSQTLSGTEVKRRYGLNVKVHAVREQQPEIVETLFGLMLEGLNTGPAPAPTPTPTP